jgi:hypothetical protein
MLASDRWLIRQIAMALEDRVAFDFAIGVTRIEYLQRGLARPFVRRSASSPEESAHQQDDQQYRDKPDQDHPDTAQSPAHAVFESIHDSPP